VPWKECSLIDERLKFIARLLDGEQMSAVCRKFNISRKTGYKLLRRYRSSGLHGLTDRSLRPYCQANQLPIQIETLMQTIDNPFGTRLSPMSWVRSVTHVSGSDTEKDW
jgi:putative transposase